MKPRIAVVGAGLIGRAHIRVLQESASCTLSATADPSVAANAGVPHYSSLGELLAKDRPDGVILATPNAMHVPQALECMRGGVPALIEKPVAASVAEGERLLAAMGGKAKLLVGHHRAHSPIMAKAKEVLDSGVLGRLVAVMGSAMFLKPDHYFAEAPWRSAPGGGPVLINMIHEVHNLRMLCGEVAAVQAFASNAVRNFPVEDTVAMNLRFASGVLGTFLLSDTAASARSWEQTSQENKAYPSYDDEDCYVIAGTQGSLSVPTMRIKRYVEERSWWKPFESSVVPMKREDPLARQLEHFAAVIRGEVEPLVSVRDGVANLRVTEAIVEAAASGRSVTL